MPGAAPLREEDPFQLPSYYSALEKGRCNGSIRGDVRSQQAFTQNNYSDSAQDCQQDNTTIKDEPKSQKRVEYWSKTYGMWIPTEITAVDHETCAVQITVKPGVWLSSNSWEKKLRVAVYLCSGESAQETSTNRDQILPPNYSEQAVKPASLRDDQFTLPRFSEQSATSKQVSAPCAKGEAPAAPLDALDSVEAFSAAPLPSQRLRSQLLDSGDPFSGRSASVEQDAMSQSADGVGSGMSYRATASFSGSALSASGHHRLHRVQDAVDRNTRMQEEQISSFFEPGATAAHEERVSSFFDRNRSSLQTGSFVWEAPPLQEPLGSREAAAIAAASFPTADASAPAAPEVAASTGAAPPAAASPLMVVPPTAAAPLAVVPPTAAVPLVVVPPTAAPPPAALASELEDPADASPTPAPPPAPSFSRITLPSETASADPSDSAEPRLPSSGSIQHEGKFVGYCCPRCRTGRLPSIESALQHCAESGLTGSTPINMAASASVGTAGTGSALKETAMDLGEEDAGVGSDAIAAGDSSLATHRYAEGELDGDVPEEASAAAAQTAREGSDAGALPTARAAADEAEAETGTADAAQFAGFCKPVASILGYCCPTCGERLGSLQEAVNHCRSAKSDELQSNGEAAAPTDQSEVPGLSTRDPVQKVMLPGQPIAYNSHGQPIIARQIDPETGVGRTMVLNEDGSCDVFGTNTVSSLLASTEDEATQWIEGFTNFQLRGLVHEVGQRLVESSRLYQHRLNMWNDVSERANLAYFGLREDATEKDLDNAYRQMAKRMHPDKNGGTEASKERFQDMKKRYEALKEKRASQDPADSQQKGDPEEDGETGEKEQKDDKTIEFDPHNRESLHETAKKMVLQLTTLENSKTTLERQLRGQGLL